MPDTKIEVRKASSAEVEQLQNISRQTFVETFASGNTRENMKHYLEENLGLPKLTEELNTKNSEFYFAELSGEIVGYLKINLKDAQTEIKNNNTLEIERIYVLKNLLGKKVAQLLFDKALQIATAIKVEYLWLAVWEENPRAIQFYQKNGFKAFDKHIFKLGDDEQTDIMMKLELNL